jgi:hypothetical protein
MSLEHQTPSELAHEFADLLERAKGMPLLKSFVRVESVEAKRLSAVLLEASDPISPLHAAAKDAREAVMRARQVPLTDQVRLRREVATDLARQLREAAGPRRA